MASLGLEQDVVDEGVYARTVERFRVNGARLPTFAQLAGAKTPTDRILDGKDINDFK